MSLSSELEVLSKRVQDLKKEVRRALLRSLGVDRLVKRAFEEGWDMHSVTNPFLVLEKNEQERAEFDHLIHSTRCWRSVDEAWANSDVEEKV